MGARRRHSADHNYTKSTTTATRNHNHHTHNYNHTHYCTHLERLLHAPLPRHEPARRRQVPVGDRRRRAVLGLPQGGVDRLDDGVVVRQRVKVVVEDGLLGCCCCCVGLLLLLWGGGREGGFMLDCVAHNTDHSRSDAHSNSHAIQSPPLPSQLPVSSATTSTTQIHHSPSLHSTPPLPPLPLIIASRTLPMMSSARRENQFSISTGVPALAAASRRAAPCSAQSPNMPTIDATYCCLKGGDVCGVCVGA